MLARLRKAQEENEGGFTLIELLVVVIIIGILAAIAIPTFLNQRKGAWEKAAQSDLRNAAIVMEEAASASGTYASATAASFKTSEGVTVTIKTADNVSYVLCANHAKLTDRADDFTLISTVGRPEALTAAC